MLWSLAGAAAAGVLAVLLPIRDVVFRVMLTGFTIAGAAALALPVSVLLDRARGRVAGLFALGLIVLEFLLALLLIWFEGSLSSQREEDIGLTMFIAALLGAPSMLLLVMITWGRTAPAGFTGLAVMLLSLVGFMVAIWGTSFDSEWAGTAATIGGVGMLSALALLLFGREDRRPSDVVLSFFGAAAGVLGVVVITTVIWQNQNRDELICLTVTAAALVAYVGLTDLVPLPGRQRWVRRGAVGCAIATVLFVNLYVLTDEDLFPELVRRLIAAGGIVTACATMALLVLIPFNRRGPVDLASAERLEMTVVCPRCHRKQPVPMGDSTCGGCGLRMQIRVEEPRCPQCGYLLYHLESDRCPECGKALVEG